ncbi:MULTISPECIES: hypothetical protein [Aneurinibacillus]|uniref:Uncharacterized protein n=1 Tax=Aneurinibacillus thermoaerophilus TaxID=143495 RepID=A0A1G7WVU4_ANETH|nr:MULTISPECIES: hypothetical protein [Aneurinibacillus]AMA73931.1 hypothetical protein ACH33_14510 [Aneurinibacillus sp. XH2]MED0674116.1 hypothetical protein [Aneurinibacillus thermoaerophilus]MED0737703.1 hypothetical protein [Aneurinibacillus thermoaerophilus]MED0755695.1 hypothetical protein [Aneurinibacillus thermoaerophilus]MED0759976.1 hypothetical protein [Aneurinibacillus thermoaerophilus]
MAMFEEPDLLGVYCERRDKGHPEEYAFEITQKYMFNFFISNMNQLFAAEKAEVTDNMPPDEKAKLLYLKKASDREKLELIRRWYEDYKDSIYSSSGSFERAYMHRNSLLQNNEY